MRLNFAKTRSTSYLIQLVRGMECECSIATVCYSNDLSMPISFSHAYRNRPMPIILLQQMRKLNLEEILAAILLFPKFISLSVVRVARVMTNWLLMARTKSYFHHWWNIYTIFIMLDCPYLIVQIQCWPVLVV